MVSLALVSFVSRNVLVAMEYNVLIRNSSPNYSAKDLVSATIIHKRTWGKKINRKQLKLKNNPPFLKLQFINICFNKLTALF